LIHTQAWDILSKLPIQTAKVDGLSSGTSNHSGLAFEPIPCLRRDQHKSQLDQRRWQPVFAT